jgi:hypothetical protein
MARPDPRNRTSRPLLDPKVPLVPETAAWATVRHGRLPVSVYPLEQRERAAAAALG